MTRTPRPRVKICGVTRVEDAQLAVSLGADYVGLIFAESARRIDVARAQEIREAIPDTMLVGVFLDQPVDLVAATARDCRLNLVQLHGTESPAYCAELLARVNLPIIKAFAAGHIPETGVLSAYTTTSFFLFDLDKNALSGLPMNDRLAKIWREVARARAQGFRIFVAGALDEGNVRDAIGETAAFCVDVCRGVESAPGVKDPGRMKRFISQVRS